MTFVHTLQLIMRRQVDLIDNNVKMYMHRFFGRNRSQSVSLGQKSSFFNWRREAISPVNVGES